MAAAHGISLLCGTWNLPGSEIEPASPALAGRFFTTEPPGKPAPSVFTAAPPGACMTAWAPPPVRLATALDSHGSMNPTVKCTCRDLGCAEKEMAAHSSILAWRILWTEEPGGLLSIGSHRVGHDWSDLASVHALEKELATHSSVLGWRIPGTEEPGGLPSMGSHKVGHDWSDLAAVAGGCTLLIRI